MGLIKLVKSLLSSRLDRKQHPCIERAKCIQREQQEVRVRIGRMKDELLATMNGEERWFLQKERNDAQSDPS